MVANLAQQKTIQTLAIHVPGEEFRACFDPVYYESTEFNVRPKQTFKQATAQDHFEKIG